MKAAQMALSPPSAPPPSLSLPLLFCILIAGPKADDKPGMSDGLLIFFTLAVLKGAESLWELTLLLYVKCIVLPIHSDIQRLQLLLGARISSAVFGRKVFRSFFVLSTRGGQCARSVAHPVADK